MEQKHVFWEALLVAIFIFALGIAFGYFIEMNRISRTLESYQQAELNLLDIKTQQEIFSLGNFDCRQAVKETIAFADRTYEDALQLEKYSEAAKLSEGITFEHKKYDILRVILWINAIKIKNNCASEPNLFHTIVYFYDYDTRDIDLRDNELVAEQSTFSKFLAELKEKYGDKIVLIPVAGNLEINSINLLKSSYSISKLPAILIDEKVKIEEMDKLNTAETYFKQP